MNAWINECYMQASNTIKELTPLSIFRFLFSSATEFKFKFHFKDVQKIQFKKFNQNKVTAEIAKWENEIYFILLSFCYEIFIQSK